MTCDHAPGRPFRPLIVRQMLRALGVVTCPACGQVTSVMGRKRDDERWRAVVESTSDRERF